MIVILEHFNFGPKGLKAFAFCPGFVVSNLRGSSEESRTGGDKAGDPKEPAHSMLDIIEGKRDADEGKFIHKDGFFPW